MTKQYFKPAIDLFVPSAKIIRDNLAPYSLLLVLPLVLTVLGDVSGSEGLGIGFFGFLGVALSIAFIPPLTKLYLITAKGKQAEINQVFEGSYAYFWRLIGLAILVGLAIVIGLFCLLFLG